MEAGTLNNKSEFGLNHLCRMVPSKHPATDKYDMKSELSERQHKRHILVNFCDVMKSLHKLESKLKLEPNHSTCYRSIHKEKRCQVQVTSQAKRIKTMETSTPVSGKTLSRSFSTYPEEVQISRSSSVMA